MRGILNYGKEEKSFLGNSHTINYIKNWVNVKATFLCNRKC